MSAKSVSSLEYKRVYVSARGTTFERIVPKEHMSKKQCRKARAQRSEDTLKWIEEGAKNAKEDF